MDFKAESGDKSVTDITTMKRFIIGVTPAHFTHGIRPMTPIYTYASRGRFIISSVVVFAHHSQFDTDKYGYSVAPFREDRRPCTWRFTYKYAFARRVIHPLLTPSPRVVYIGASRILVEFLEPTLYTYAARVAR